MIELLSADNIFLLKCPESGQSRIRQSAVLSEIDLVQSVFDSKLFLQTFQVDSKEYFNLFELNMAINTYEDMYSRIRWGEIRNQILLFLLSFIAMAIYFIKDNYSIQFPEPYVNELVRNRLGSQGLFPLKDVNCIVTGSTSGLGKEISSELYRLGATVIMTARNNMKGKEIESEIKSEHPSSIGKLIIGTLDTSDLVSVKNFASWYQHKVGSLDFLINNAGINYINTPVDYLKNTSEPAISRDGFDLAFATNYFGHFLLTELLLPSLKDKGKVSTARIVNVASTFHGQVDGSYLRPGKNGEYPLAARADRFSKRSSDILHQRNIAYGNNKLAQVLHAKELQRILDINPSNRRIEIVSTCPGFTSTNIFKDDLLGNFIRARAFNAKAGALAPICSLFSSDVKGGEFVTNFYNFWASQSYSPALFKFLSFLGIRHIASLGLSLYILLYQGNSYGCQISESSPESHDSVLAKDLYNWSIKVLKEKKYL